MKKTIVFLAALMGVSACTVQSEPPIVNINERDIKDVITVTGTGEAVGVPDVLRVTLGVSVIRPTVDAANGDAAALANEIIEAVKAGGVQDRDIQTTSYTVYPEYDYSRDTRLIIGYRVGNILSIKIRDIEKGGEVIDAAVEAGGDDAVVNSISFEIEDDAELVKEARDAAWADAEEKANQLAGLAGVTLGRAVTISETTYSSPPAVYAERAMAMDGAASTPIQSGELTVSISVNVQFMITS